MICVFISMTGICRCRKQDFFDNLLFVITVINMTATSRSRRIINNGFCKTSVIRSKRRLMIVPKKEKPITAFLICALSALRLCVWLFDNWYIHLLYVNKGFLFAFRAVQRKVFQFGIVPYLQPCFTVAYGAYYPFGIHTKCPNPR